VRKRRSQTQARKRAAVRRRKADAKRREALVIELGMAGVAFGEISEELERRELRKRLSERQG
jgi:hypothetical protein